MYDGLPYGRQYLVLPVPYVVKRATRTSLSMPRHALIEPISGTYSTGRTLIHSAVQIWNGLPDSVVGAIYDNGAQSF